LRWRWRNGDADAITHTERAALIDDLVAARSMLAAAESSERADVQAAPDQVERARRGAPLL